MDDNDCTCRRCLLHDDPGGCLYAGARQRAVWASLPVDARVVLRRHYRALRRDGRVAWSAFAETSERARLFAQLHEAVTR